MIKPKFFAKQESFRKWLDKNHEKKDELWVGFYKLASSLPSMNWSESVDQALCYGWIDGIRKSIDDKSYMIRFTPRRPNSNWSAVNVKKVKELSKQNLMQPAGIAAYKKLEKDKSKIYSFEQNSIKLDSVYKIEFKKNEKAWKYFEASASSYKNLTTWWVMSAKREETRQRRLGILIESSTKEEKIPQMTWKKKK